MNKLDSLFRDFIEEHPFNSAATVLRVIGESPPESFGGNCIELCQELRNRILEEIPELKVYFLTQQYGSHQALLVESPESKRYLLDPTILHEKPFRVDNLEEEDATQQGTETLPGYPIRFTAKQHNGQLVISRHTFSEVDQNYVLRRCYRFSINLSSTAIHITQERIFQNKDELPAIFRTAEGIFILRYTKSDQTVTTGFFSKPKTQTKASAIEEIGETLLPVSDATKIPVSELLEMFRKAFKIFEERAYIDHD
jgi:hypothetical protein